MKKLFAIVVSLIIISCIFVGCTVFSPIVGKWQDSDGNTYEFDRTGNVEITANDYVITGTWSTVSGDVINLNMQGDAGNIFGLAGVNSFQYTISGNTMTMVAGGGTSKLYKVQTPTISLTYPQGGEKFHVGQTINVTWTSTDVDYEAVYISINGGEFTALSSTGNWNNFNWSISQLYVGKDKIKIESDVYNGTTNISTQSAIKSFNVIN